jgi:hypothetical protein
MKTATILTLCSIATLTLPSLGCDADPSAEAEVQARGLTFAGSDCPRWRCGYNTSEINGKSLQELHLDGDPNSDGVELVGFLPPLGLLLDYELDTEGDALIARGGLFGSSKLRGHQLIGGVLLVKVEAGLIVPVVIADYEEVDSWSADGDPVSAYALTYADLEAPLLQRSVCKGTLVDPLQASVVILAGERYDLDGKTVIPDQDRWFTLACAGSAAAKMSLLGYGPNAELDGAPSTADQRQSTLKMITADYCGDGTSYTEDGTALLWENQSGSVNAPDADPDDLEAVWTADGALCLDTPRVVDAGDVACALPSCDSLTLDDGEWATYLPGL